MRHLHDTRAPFWTGIGTGSRARQVQDPNGGSRVRCRFWPHKKALPSSSLSFLAAKKTPYRYPFSAMQTSTRSIKTKGKKPKRQTSVSSLLLRRLEVTEKSGCESKAASRFFSLHGDKSTASTLREVSVKGHSVLCKTSCTSSLMRATLWEQIKSAVVYSSYLCTQRFLPNNYLAKWGQP